MKRHIIFFMLIISGSLFSQQRNYYQGTLEVNKTTLPLNIEYMNIEADTLELLFASPSQAANQIVADKAYLKGDSILFRIRNLGVTYRGRFSQNQDTINGMFYQGVFKSELMFVKTSAKPAANRPQTPKPPFDYIIEELSFTNPQLPNYQFNGTFTRPKKEGKYPCIIFISGSGLQDRNEELFEHKPFFVLSDWLTKLGFATFRFDDRGWNSNDTALLKATTLDYVSDVEAAVAMLAKHQNVNATQIGLCGHSEGALIACIVGSKDSSLRFIVLMAPQGVSGRQVLMSQNKALMLSMGIEDKDSINARLTEVESMLNDPKMLNPWLKTFIDLDPKDYLTQITQPTLIVQGLKDLQVVPEDNLPSIRKYFGSKSGNKNLEIAEFPGLNHLFQRCETGLPSEYYLIEQTIYPDVLNVISAFIKDKTLR